MAGITNAERERRRTEAALIVQDRPFRDRANVVCFVGGLQRGFCAPCNRRAWGAEVRIGDAGTFRCQACLSVIARQLAARANEPTPDDLAAERRPIGEGEGVTR